MENEHGAVARDGVLAKGAGVVKLRLVVTTLMIKTRQVPAGHCV